MLWNRFKFSRFCGVALTLFTFGFPQASFLEAATAPPPNDICDNAEIIPGAGPFPYLSLRIPDITAATTNGDPVPLPSDCDFIQGLKPSRGVWYKFIPTVSGLYMLSANDNATTVDDTFLAVFTSDGGCNGPFHDIACNDDAGSTQSAILTSLGANTTYYILLYKTTPDAPAAGHTAVQLKVTNPQVPGNDLCAGAEIIPSAGPFPYFTATSDTLLATNVGDPPLPSGTAAVYRSVWYRFAPAASGAYVFTTVPNTATRLFDSVVAVYTSSSGCGGPFTEVACGGGSFDVRGAATATLVAGTTYYVVVWDYEEADPGFNTVQLGVWRTGAPAVTTLPASSVSSTTVVLNSSVTPNTSSEPSPAWFEWGTSTSYGTTTPITSVATNLVKVPVAQTVAVNPVPNVSYHFRAAASNSNGTNYGADRTFVWSTNRPHLNISHQANRTYRLQFTGNSNQLYRVEGSSTLPNWSDLGVATDLGTNAFEFIDFNAILYSNRFYRFRAP